MDTPTLIVQPPEVSKGISAKVLGVLVVAMIIVGGMTGFGFSRTNSNRAKIAGAAVTPATVKTDTEEGVTDTQTFSDTATGELQAGGLGTEGTHKLIRTGGPSQTVYLISSIVDLDGYVGKTVEVFGQTLKAQKAPWLMDVGRIKLVQ